MAMLKVSILLTSFALEALIHFSGRVGKISKDKQFLLMKSKFTDERVEKLGFN